MQKQRNLIELIYTEIEKKYEATVPRYVIKDVLDALGTVTTDMLENGETVTIPDVVTLNCIDKAEKICHLPSIKGNVIPAGKKLGYRFAKGIKEAVNRYSNNSNEM